MWNEVGAGNLGITTIVDNTWITEPNEEIESASNPNSSVTHSTSMD